MSETYTFPDGRTITHVYGDTWKLSDMSGASLGYLIAERVELPPTVQRLRVAP